jgi:hypothetical protein
LEVKNIFLKQKQQQQKIGFAQALIGQPFDTIKVRL